MFKKMLIGNRNGQEGPEEAWLQVSAMIIRLESHMLNTNNSPPRHIIETAFLLLLFPTLALRFGPLAVHALHLLAVHV